MSLPAYELKPRLSAGQSQRGLAGARPDSQARGRLRHCPCALADLIFMLDFLCVCFFPGKHEPRK